MLIVIQTTNVAGVKITDKSCLIMDEVDGMSAGDRGGVGALVALIKKTKVWLVLQPLNEISDCLVYDRYPLFVLPTIRARKS